MKRTFVALFAISLVACGMNYDKTPSGLTYKIFRGNGTEKPKAGEFIKFNIEYKLEDRDSVLQSTFGSIPGYSAIDTGKRVQYSYMEVLPLMSVGDSAVISINVDSLKSKKLIENYTPLLVKGQVLLIKLKLLQVFKQEKDVLADYKKAQDEQKGNEIKSLEGYMAKNNLKGVKSKNGVYVVVENAGDPALKAGSRESLLTLMCTAVITAEATGKEYLITNMDTTKGHTDPIQFVVGAPGTIQGFSEGLPYFGKGGKGKLLIPSMLGYGPQPQGADLPGFSNLVFDIEVKDVKDAPPAQNMNPMQQQQMQQQLQEQMQQQQQEKDSTHNK